MTRARTWAPWIAVVVVLGVLLTLAQARAGREVLRHLGLAAEPHRYVALSFTSVQSLPYSVPVDSRPALSVTVDSHEGKDVDFKLVATQTGSETVVASSSISVPDGKSRTVDIVTPVSCPNATEPSPLRVTITLSPSGQSISHTMMCRPTS